MTRTNLASLMVLAIGVPAAAAASFFSTPAVKSCFVAGQTGYRMATGAAADFTVRIDNTATHPSLRMQLVDDPGSADFVLLDDGASACGAATPVKTVRLDPAAKTPDLTVALSPAPGDYRIYVKSAQYSGEDAAALFAVIWHSARRAGLSRALVRP
jgi:hypothetical protein